MFASPTTCAWRILASSTTTIWDFVPGEPSRMSTMGNDYVGQWLDAGMRFAGTRPCTTLSSSFAQSLFESNSAVP